MVARAENLLDALDELEEYVTTRWRATHALEWSTLHRWIELARLQLQRHVRDSQQAN